jgi:hypothetical protein
MRRFTTSLFPVLGLAVVAAAHLSAQSATPSADEVVARNLAAKGGVERLRALQSTRITATATLQDVTAPMVIEAKKPNLMRQEITVQGRTVIQAFDGTHAWISNPTMGPRPVQLPDAQSATMKSESDFDGPLLDYQRKGTKVELAGVESIEGHQAYHLKVQPSGGEPRDYYIDADTGLEFRVDSPITQAGQQGTLVVHMSDYRDVDGLKMPFALEQSIGGRTVGKLAISKIELNVPIDDDRFKAPSAPGPGGPGVVRPTPAAR